MLMANQSARLTLSGVLIAIDGLGVLLRGTSGAGKSELALCLLDRGHQLIADDRVQLYRQTDTLLGYAMNPCLAGFIETRGLGILNVHKLLSDSAVATSAPLTLIVELTAPPPETTDRFTGHYATTTLLGCQVDQFFLPPTASRHLGLLVELAFKQCRLRHEMAYDSRQDFAERQQQMVT